MSELASLFPEYSTMTIRRDIDYLEKQGFIVRTRGGAKSISHLTRLKEEVFDKRALDNREAKDIIAQKALRFLEEGQSYYFDSGTTIIRMVRIIPKSDPGWFILTSGPNVAVELCRFPDASVTILGGSLNPENLSISGASALEQIKNINLDVAFIATSGFSVGAGFSVGNINEAELKRLVISRAQKVVMLMDRSKIDIRLPYSFANLSDVDVLIAEDELPEEIQNAALAANTTLI